MDLLPAPSPLASTTLAPTLVPEPAESKESRTQPKSSPEPGLTSPANLLTLSRLILGIGVVAAISFEEFAVALGLFFLASLTDAFDGMVARARGETSKLGRQLDPLVDKLLVAAVLIFLLPRGDSGFGPVAVSLIILRELMIQAVRSAIEAKGGEFGAKPSGKLKTILQTAAIHASLLSLALASPSAPEDIPAWLIRGRDLLITAAVAMTVLSGAAYLRLAWKLG
ncbi:CDP-alcohol phosphatidyltransferase [Isosphaera pallida ATCC 43644]|uniref:CDP-alcohol phosphatidyltransferase n=1 Tax=Isosphaera pallida (strain ATCC 43644 / DSM 9630 / IS1B) TaxID=575540 RepID=E8R3H1_ISOPI|nr:CDP-alcohol phosphatidyltransferase family protein [Isosphaera pallida]ADV61538.1 CDP-alcohol phosphatidyltransferase [Isosphaera pallida ATCC 43644]